LGTIFRVTLAVLYRRIWSIVGNYSILCCDKEEEELKASIDTKDTATGSFPTNEQSDKDDDDEADLAKMSEKDKKKNNKEAERAKEKARKNAVKAGKKVEGSSKMSKDVDATPSASDQVPKIYPSISQVAF
jgi:hypothetical protein